MAYTYQVALTLLNEDYEMLMMQIEGNNAEAVELIKKASIFQNEDSTTLFWDEIEWYSSDNEVRCLEQYIKSGITYQIIKLGEDENDISIQRFFNSYSKHPNTINWPRISISVNVKDSGKKIQ